MITGTGYLRAGQIAHQLGVSERTVRRWIATKVLPSAKVGGARLVARANVERLLSPDWNPDEDFDLEDE